MLALARRLLNDERLLLAVVIVVGCATAAIGTSIGMLIYDLYQLFH